MNQKISKINNSDVPVYRCTRCGFSDGLPTGKFYMSKSSDLFEANSGFSCLCQSCVKQLIESIQTKTNLKTAYLTVCHYLDLYFDEDLFDSMRNNENFSFGNYVSGLNTRRNKKTFARYLQERLKDGLLVRTQREVEEFNENKWSASDLINKNFCLKTVGYDPFGDDTYTNNDKKYLYNTLASYLGNGDLPDDPHGVQSAISLVKSLLQNEKIDCAINIEIASRTIDEERLKKLTDAKKNLVANITSLANDNNISAKSSGKNKSSNNALTQIMKDIEENGYEDGKVNLYRAKLSESYREIADINTRAIIEGLNMNMDEYMQMVAEQNEILSQYQRDNDDLKEELRQAKIKISILTKENRG